MSRLERIVRAVGGVLYDNGRRALVPGPGHSPHDRSVSLLDIGDGRLLVHCFSPRDDWTAVVAWLNDHGFEATRSAASWQKKQPSHAHRIFRARRLWSETGPTEASPAAQYLHARGIRRSPNINALRFHPRASSIDDKLRRPALVAAIMDGQGRVQGVEITLLTSAGSRARVATPRRIVGKLSGGAVRLHEAGATLIVAEGVMTALSASEVFNLPAHAALTAHNLARFSPPPEVEKLIVAADNDEAGLQAARRLQNLLPSQIVIEVSPAPEPFNDWNDWLSIQARSIDT